MINKKQVFLSISHLRNNILELKSIFNFNYKCKRLVYIKKKLESYNLIKDLLKIKYFRKEKIKLEEKIYEISKLSKYVDDIESIFDLACKEDNQDIIFDIQNEIKKINQKITEIEFKYIFSDKMDKKNAYMDIQSGSGGIDAQDWSNMLLRMYLRWADKHSFISELLECSFGEIAGIKSATIKFFGEYTYGLLKTETGIHRLVRKSPFDSSNRRHTSFSSVFVYPEIDDNINVMINFSDLRIDTYHSSGAGGQHVNCTNSAVRITHEPTGIVVQCQSHRSQHRNKAQAIKQLRAKLYEIEVRKKQVKKEVLNSNKLKISWGSQIRSYVLDKSQIKDLRTGIIVNDVQSVLYGDIDLFIKSNLRKNVSN
ncbi:peptide chain release factor 2 [Candidatus Legionella polyplacis]|uniref:peptide chain release factor 2 n=1 Tax=Candidatus Legionella polyplacis TaxID=2005262 RepID=UPI000C1EBA2A|nr:peptide chain release factor 2 [Candidatus Legionella polyplacis]ATW01952.1 peptide chain release factor 2 [Candidatus Legionella polyplacis]